MMQKTACGLFILCTFFFQQTSAGKKVQMNLDDAPKLGDAEKIYGLSRFWQEVNYKVVPHVSVEPTVEDLLSDRDPVLEKGVEVLRGEMD